LFNLTVRHKPAYEMCLADVRYTRRTLIRVQRDDAKELSKQMPRQL